MRRVVCIALVAAAALLPQRVAAQFVTVTLDSLYPRAGQRVLDLNPGTRAVDFAACVRYSYTPGGTPVGSVRRDTISADLRATLQPQQPAVFATRFGIPDSSSSTFCGPFDLTSGGGAAIIGTVRKGTYDFQVQTSVHWLGGQYPTGFFAGANGSYESPVYFWPSPAELQIRGDSIRADDQAHALVVEHDLGPGQRIFVRTFGKLRVGEAFVPVAGTDTTRFTDVSDSVRWNFASNFAAIYRYDVRSDTVPDLARGSDRAFVVAGSIAPTTTIEFPFPAGQGVTPAFFTATGRALPGMTVRLGASSSCSSTTPPQPVAADSTWSLPAIACPFGGNHGISIIGRDLDGLEDTASVAIVAAANQPPNAFITSPAVAEPGVGIDTVIANPGEQLNFTANASDPEGAPLSVLWDFGDQTSSSELEPGLRTLPPGTRIVTFTATDNFGESAADTVVVIVREPPVIRFTTPVDGSSQRLRFTVSGVATPGGRVTITQCVGCSAFGDTTTAAGDSTWTFPDVRFSQTGPNNFITAEVLSVDDLTASATVSFTILPNQSPVATITAPVGDTVTVAAGDSLFFAGNGTDADGVVVESRWLTADTLPPVPGDTLGFLVFPDTGLVVVSFIVTDDIGDEGVDEVVVRVRRAPFLAITAPTDGANVPPRVTIAGRASPGDTVRLAGCTACDGVGRVTAASPADSTWTFPDVIFAQPGQATLTVRAITDEGIAVERTIAINVLANQLPVAVITAPASDTSVAPGESVTFRGTATDADGSIASVAWDFGNGDSAAVLEPPAVTFAAVGTYTVTFRATDDLGAVSATDSLTVTVREPPVVRILAPASGATIGAVVDLVGRATPGATVRLTECTDCSVLDSSVVAAADSAFTLAGVTFTSEGQVFVTLEATDAFGLRGETTTSFIVSANVAPTVTIIQPATPPVIAVGDSVRFVATATDPEGGAVTIRWIFTPADTVFGADAGFRRYELAGVYLATVRATDSFGAFAEASVTITVGGRGPNVDITTPGSAERVDGHDVVFVMRAMRTQDLRADVNGDGVVDAADLALVRAAFGARITPTVRTP